MFPFLFAFCFPFHVLATCTLMQKGQSYHLSMMKYSLHLKKTHHVMKKYISYTGFDINPPQLKTELGLLDKP